MAIEIERKFLVRDLPVAEMQIATTVQIQQGYLILEPDREVRIRRAGERFFLTEKQGDGMVREECRIAITEAMFNALWPLTKAMRLEKVRSTFTLEGYQLELDVYKGKLKPLMVLEIEFPAVEQATAWTPPWFADREVTGNNRYSNAQLAAMGKPDNE